MIQKNVACFCCFFPRQKVCALNFGIISSVTEDIQMCFNVKFQGPDVFILLSNNAVSRGRDYNQQTKNLANVQVVLSSINYVI